MKLKWRGLQFEHYILGILLAVEWIMSFTFLGYIHIPPISITTAHIPIVVIACLFGPVESSVAGLFFGLGSMYKASALYVMLGDRISDRKYLVKCRNKSIIWIFNGMYI